MTKEQFDRLLEEKLNNDKALKVLAKAQSYYLAQGYTQAARILAELYFQIKLEGSK